MNRSNRGGSSLPLSSRYMLTSVLAGGLFLSPGDILAQPHIRIFDGTKVAVAPDQDGQTLKFSVEGDFLFVNEVQIELNRLKITEIQVEQGDPSFSNTISLGPLKGLLLPAVQKIHCDLGENEDTYIGGVENSELNVEFFDSGTTGTDTVKFEGSDSDDKLFFGDEAITDTLVAHYFSGIESTELSLKSGSDFINMESETLSLNYVKIECVEDAADEDVIALAGTAGDDIFEFDGTTSLRHVYPKIEVDLARGFITIPIKIDYSGIDKIAVNDSAGTNSLSFSDTDDADVFYMDDAVGANIALFGLNEVDFEYSGSKAGLDVYFGEGDDTAYNKATPKLMQFVSLQDSGTNDSDTFDVQGTPDDDLIEVALKSTPVLMSRISFDGFETFKLDTLEGNDTVKFLDMPEKQDYILFGNEQATTGTGSGGNLSIVFLKVEFFDLELGDGGDSARWHFNNDWPVGMSVRDVSTDDSDTSFSIVGTEGPDTIKFIGDGHVELAAGYLKIGDIKGESIEGNGGDDQFFIHPSRTTKIHVDGGSGTGDIDKLIYDSLNALPIFVKTRREAGAIQLSGYQDVTFEEIEELELINVPQQDQTWNVK